MLMCVCHDQFVALWLEGNLHTGQEMLVRLVSAVRLPRQQLVQQVRHGPSHTHAGWCTGPHTSPACLLFPSTRCERSHEGMHGQAFLPLHAELHMRT